MVVLIIFPTNANGGTPVMSLWCIQRVENVCAARIRPAPSNSADNATATIIAATFTC